MIRESMGVGSIRHVFTFVVKIKDLPLLYHGSWKFQVSTLGPNKRESKISVENMPIILAVKQIAYSATSFKLHVFSQPGGTLSVL